MSDLSRVVWSEGMLLSPHHFQQAERNAARRLDALIGEVGAPRWGLSELAIDKKALADGRVQLTRARGVMPDGTVFDLDWDAGTSPAARELPSSERPSVAVYLAIPVERPGHRNYIESASAPAAGDHVRFQTKARTVADLVGDAEPMEVEFSAPNLRLLLDDEAGEGFVAIKLADVVRGATPTLGAYVPPALNLRVAARIHERLIAIARRAEARREALCRARRHAGAEQIEFYAADLSRFLLLDALNGGLSVLTHWLDTPERASTYEVYLFLRGWAARLSTFSGGANESAESPVWKGFASYDHTDLKTSFEGVLSAVERYVDTVVKQRYARFELSGREDGVHFARLESVQWSAGSSSILAVRSETDSQTTAKELPLLAKLGSWEDVGTLLASSTSGVGLEFVHRPPPEIPVTSGTVYFRLDHSSPYFDRVREAGALAVYLPPSFAPSTTQLELLVIGAEQPRQSAGGAQ